MEVGSKGAGAATIFYAYMGELAAGQPDAATARAN